MRIILLLLLVANLLFVGVSYFLIEPKKQETISDRERERGSHSLILLSELEVGQLRELKELSDPSVGESEDKKQVDCLKIVGDWDRDKLAQVKQALSEKEKKVLAEGRERRKKVNYWVVIPPFSSRQEAMTAKRQLHSEKILDTFIIKSGARANALSLGLYSNEEGALRRAEFVDGKRLGIAQANIEELALYVDRYWIKVLSADDESDAITSLIGKGVLDTKIEQCEIEK